MSSARAPWHLWVIGVVFLGIYIGGARDYLLILLNDQDYLQRQFGAIGTAYFTGYPLGLRIVWTVTIAGGLLAPVFLLVRSRWAVPIAVVAAAAQVVLILLTFAFRDRWHALGAAYSLFDIGVAAATIGLALYCRRLRSRGALA